jgi:hypothetical protein
VEGQCVPRCGYCNLPALADLFARHATHFAPPVVHEAAKAMLVLVVMETLLLTRDSSWLEVRLRLDARGICALDSPACVSPQKDHVDYLYCQALMFGHTGSNLLSQAKLIFIRSRRLG